MLTNQTQDFNNNFSAISLYRKQISLGHTFLYRRAPITPYLPRRSAYQYLLGPTRDLDADSMAGAAFQGTHVTASPTIYSLSAETQTSASLRHKALEFRPPQRQ